VDSINSRCSERAKAGRSVLRPGVKSVCDEGFKYRLELIDVLSEHSPVLIFQNEKGGRSKAIDMAGIKGRYDNVYGRIGTVERGG